jgi:hypothetical protein
MQSRESGKLGLGGIRKRWLLSFIAVLIVPAAGFLVALFNTRAVIIRETVQSSLMVNKSIQASIDARFAQGSQIAANIILDKRFRDIIQKKNTWQDIVVQQEDFIRLLTYYKSANPGTDILIHVSGLNYIFTADTANSLGRLYGALSYLGRAGIGKDEWGRLLAGTGGETQFVSSPYLSYTEFGREALVYCASTRQPIFGSCYPTGIFVSVSYDTIAEMFEDRGDSTILILGQDGAPLYSFGMAVPGLEISLEENPRGYQIIRYQGKDYVCTFRKSETGPFAYAVMTKQTSFWNWYNTVERIIIAVMLAALALGLAMSLYLLQINYRPVRSVMNTLVRQDLFPETGRGGGGGGGFV